MKRKHVWISAVLLAGVLLAGAGVLVRQMMLRADVNERVSPLTGPIGAAQGEALLATLEPQTAEDVPPEFLGPWLQTAQQRLGAYLKPDLWKIEISPAPEAPDLTRVQGRMLFEKGAAELVMERSDRGVRSFTLTSSRMYEWGPGPVGYSQLDRFGAEFIVALLEWETKDGVNVAHARMTEQAREEHPLGALELQVLTLVNGVGRLESVQPVMRKLVMDGDFPKFDIYYNVVCRRDETTFRVRMVYPGWATEPQVTQYDQRALLPKQ